MLKNLNKIFPTCLKFPPKKVYSSIKVELTLLDMDFYNLSSVPKA